MKAQSPESERTLGFSFGDAAQSCVCIYPKVSRARADKDIMRRKTLSVCVLALACLSGGSTVAPAPEPATPPAPKLEAPGRVSHRLVDAIQAETLIRDRALAVIVTHAIEDAASEFDVSPWMLATLIRIESSGRPSVVSHAGAIGLTQILPGTAEEIARELHIAEYDLTDPATNVRMGAYYVSKLLARFDGDEGAALAAYNYGPTAVARMLRNGEPLPVVYAGKILSRL